MKKIDQLGEKDNHGSKECHSCYSLKTEAQTQKHLTIWVRKIFTVQWNWSVTTSVHNCCSLNSKTIDHLGEKDNPGSMELECHHIGS